MEMKFLDEKELVRNPVIPAHEHLFSWIKPYIKNKKILDIGCWTGPIEILLEKHGNYNVTAVDIKEEPLAYCKKRFSKFNFKKASVIEKLPFSENTFDIVLFFMVIEHLPKESELKALRNISRVIKKGGSLFLNTMHSNPLSILLDPAYFLKKHRHYSRNQLEKLLSDVGFEIKEVHYNGGFFTVAHIWLLYFFKHILKRNEPRSKLMDILMGFEYHNIGFNEIDIRAVKINE